jgi:hypothetical protein
MSAVTIMVTALLIPTEEGTMKNLLISRKFWAMVLGLAVLIIAQVVPNFKLDTEAGAGLAVVVGSYIVGVAVDPGPGGWRGVVQSRKFYVALFGLAFMVLSGFGVIPPTWVTQDMMVEIAVMIGTLIGGIAIEGVTQPKPVSEHDAQSWG